MRLVTRSDFDGLASGALLLELGIIDKWKFVHPKDVQDGEVIVGPDDVLANIPYAEGCGMWFDHHSSEISRMGKDKVAKGECRMAPSCARVIYEYYGGKDKLPHLEDLVVATDKVDSGQLTVEEIQNPTGWVLLGFLMDPRTGIGRFRQFTISNYELMAMLLPLCGKAGIDEILNQPDVQERVQLYLEQSELFKVMLKEKTRVHKNVIITDLRGVETIYAGNRFMIYSLYPEQNVSVWVVDGRAINCPIAVGYSVINRTCDVDVGELMAKYGGGGHKQVGTCQVPYDEADKAIKEITEALSQ
jgi:nanoRNase/pAp phosphatase (c-di-AMP/oligoRNAs hydrolase)